jgi:predicted RNA-binding Zn ribbon-like protein
MALELNAGHWPEAEAILGPSLPLRLDAELNRQATKAFNDLAAAHPVTPWISDTVGPAPAPGLPGERFVIPTMRWADREGEIVYWLWTLLQSPHRDRLKRCKVCPAWFVDQTNARMKLYCSSDCHDKDWPRERRRRQGHKAFRTSSPLRSRR